MSLKELIKECLEEERQKERTKKERAMMYRAAGCLGTFSGWLSYQWPVVRHAIVRIFTWLIFVTAATIIYVEIGHDKGWFRADTWYECLHKHNHFGITIP